ncbi:MAG TPA: hypothetical protein DEG47_22095, partial [Cyanobacteria bacterium UBA11148]|nr:hypothetical protein [Cyanobacteria bacterium UBA11148]
MIAENILKKLSLTVVGSVLIALGTSGAAQGMSLLGSSKGQIGTIDTITGNFTRIATSRAFTDIALSDDNQLFGITFNQLFKVDTTTGLTTLIGNLGVSNMNALGFSTANVLYGTGGVGFYSINTSTGAASLVSEISGFTSSGDIVFDPVGNRFLATSNSSLSDDLFSIALDGTAQAIGSIGFKNVYGLFFENGTLFGYTIDRKQIVIDMTTGKGTFNKMVAGTLDQIWGSASLPSTGPLSAPSSEPSPEPS